MLDRCGKPVHEGSVVDLMLNGTYSGVVTAVIDLPTIISGAPPQMPCVLIQLQLTLPSHDGRTVQAYVIRDAESFMPKTDSEGTM